MQGSPERIQRALYSLEYTIQMAKQNAGSLLHGSRRLKERHDEKSDTRDWLLFAYTLLEVDSGHNLARLVHEQVIAEDAIPDLWTFFQSGGFPLKDSIENQRAFLARHILICTLPAVMGISMYGE